jgi:hypothetical protein
VPVTFFRRKGGRDEIMATLDTVAIDAQQGFLTLAWRATLPLKKSIFEVSNILAGRMSSGWWRARELGKDLASVARRPRAQPARSAGGRGMSAASAMSAAPIAIVIAIARAGLVTGVGLDAAATCAAIRGAIDNFQQTGFRDTAGEWLMGCEVALPQAWRGEAKLVKMAARAVTQCLAGLDRAACEAMPLLLCLPEAERPGRLVPDDARFFEALEARARPALS